MCSADKIQQWYMPRTTAMGSASEGVLPLLQHSPRLVQKRSHEAQHFDRLEHLSKVISMCKEITAQSRTQM
jgi:hypothetical protein